MKNIEQKNGKRLKLFEPFHILVTNAKRTVFSKGQAHEPSSI